MQKWTKHRCIKHFINGSDIFTDIIHLHCTVVGSCLDCSKHRRVFYPIIGMLGFSIVFAAPFFLLSLFPAYLKKMPKSGGWMNNIKVVMGFLELAFALNSLAMLI